MGQYQRGDVILASVTLDDRSSAKTRPAVVIACEITGTIQVCPVSSKLPSDAPCIPVSLDDFSAGGLDLFGESYVMTSRLLTLRSGDVIGKKGRLTAESLAEIAGLVPAAMLPNIGSTQGTRKLRNGQ
jgi:mRNA-degrading endonuclease toxin of MazEF toxin-antitoxin module